jgi:hypothetical protein
MNIVGGLGKKSSRAKKDVSQGVKDTFASYGKGCH